MLWNITCVIIVDNNKDLHSLFAEMSNNDQHKFILPNGKSHGCTQTTGPYVIPGCDVETFKNCFQEEIFKVVLWRWIL